MLRKSAVNMLAQIAALGVSVADRIVLVGVLIRAWGAPLYSDWATLAAMAGLVSLAELGFQIQYGNRLAQARAQSDVEAYQSLLGAGLFVYLGIATVLITTLLAALLLGIDVSTTLKLKVLGVGGGTIFAVLATSNIVRLARASISQIYRSQGEFHRGILTDAAALAISVFGAVGAALVGGGPLTMAAVYLVVEVLAWGVLGRDVKQRYPLELRPRLPSRDQLVVLWRSLGWYALLAGLPTAWIQVPVLEIGLLGYGGAGLVAFAVQRSLVNFGRTLCNLSASSFGIELSSLDRDRDSVRLEYNVGVVGRFNGALAGLLMAAAVTFGPHIVALWTGQPDLGSALLLGILALPVALTAGASPFHMLCVYAGEPKPAALGLILQVGLGVSLSLALGLKFRIFGVAVGLALAEVVGTGVLMPWLAAKVFRLRYLSLAMGSLGRAAVTFFSGALAAYLVGVSIPARTPLALFLGVVIWGVFAATPLMFLTLPPSARRQIWQAMGRAKPSRL